MHLFLKESYKFFQHKRCSTDDRSGATKLVQPISEQSWVWTDDAVRALLGRVTDGELGRRLDITPGGVRCKRLSLGIPAFDPKA
jgi:hypothetical protein